MQLDQLIRAIHQGTWTNQQLNIMADAIKFARAQQARSVARQIQKGTEVQFTSRNRTYRGPVVDVLIKNAVVETQFGRYRVPMNMLEVL